MVIRTILHCDMNNFYASVECLYDPALRDVPMAVGGDPELRHGIVLAKNTIAKQCGVKTGQALWEARQRCPGIVFVPPDYPKYLHFSQMAREIYETYTDRVEPFGPDECWLDVTGSANLFGTGRSIADSLRARVKAEMGVTLSVGVSFNKVFAKLGSDMKKPDATTEIGLDDFREKVWPLPVSELLYIGSATRRKLNQYHIGTIGALAQTDAAYLSHWFGKVGTMLWRFANGLDSSPVCAADAVPLIKSIGNSTTTPRDLVCDEDVKITLFVLAESVAARLREAGFLCRTVQLTVRDNQLNVLQRQEQLPSPACASSLLADAALRLFRETFPGGGYAVRTIGVRACGLIQPELRQLSFLPEEERAQRRETLEAAMDGIRSRYGHFSIQRGVMLTDKALSNLNPKADHVLHPVGLLK